MHIFLIQCYHHSEKKTCTALDEPRLVVEEEKLAVLSTVQVLEIEIFLGVLHMMCTFVVVFVGLRISCHTLHVFP